VPAVTTPGSHKSEHTNTRDSWVLKLKACLWLKEKRRTSSTIPAEQGGIALQLNPIALLGHRQI